MVPHAQNVPPSKRHAVSFKLKAQYTYLELKKFEFSHFHGFLCGGDAHNSGVARKFRQTDGGFGGLGSRMLALSKVSECCGHPLHMTDARRSSRGSG